MDKHKVNQAASRHKAQFFDSFWYGATALITAFWAVALMLTVGFAIGLVINWLREPL
jgi:ABC-type dipeptide/oligopeptide/nickel transport system permease subunit